MNKNGWGLRVELLFILLFVICLLISTLGLNKFGLIGNSDDGLVKDNTDASYTIIEKKVTEAANKYYNDKYPSGSTDTVIVNLDSLYANGYISKVYDNNGNECKGYAKILKNGVCISYIRCSRYETTGYTKDNE